jgi:leucyl-tRNA synthetase
MASRFNPLKADAHWQKVWDEAGIFRAPGPEREGGMPQTSPGAPERIHMGHVRACTMADVLARYRRMNGERGALPPRREPPSWSPALRHLGLVGAATASAGRLTAGTVTHETYRASDGRRVSPDEIEWQGGGPIEAATGQKLETGPAERMSAAKRNALDPGPIVDQYGADAVRWFLLADTPPERDLEWNEAGLESAWRFVQRLWRLASTDRAGTGPDAALAGALNRAIAAVGADIEALAFNKAVAGIYALANAIEQGPASAARAAAIETLIRLAAPIVPHVAEQAWAASGRAGLIADAAWPEAEPALPALVA